MMYSQNNQPKAKKTYSHAKALRYLPAIFGYSKIAVLCTLEQVKGGHTWHSLPNRLLFSCTPHCQLAPLLPETTNEDVITKNCMLAQSTEGTSFIKVFVLCSCTVMVVDSKTNTSDVVTLKCMQAFKKLDWLLGNATHNNVEVCTCEGK